MRNASEVPQPRQHLPYGIAERELLNIFEVFLLEFPGTLLLLLALRLGLFISGLSIALGSSDLLVKARKQRRHCSLSKRQLTC